MAFIYLARLTDNFLLQSTFYVFKVILHCQHALETTEGTIVIRSPSGDTDIIIIALALLESSRVFFDNGTGKYRKRFWLHNVKIDNDVRKAIIGLHSFSGNDYVSSFFKKGKRVLFKMMKSKQDFIDIFIKLGSSWDIDEFDLADLEEFVCHIYGSKDKDINDVRRKLFDR